MNIIIPLGGKGDRFKVNGYKEPKPLIKVFDKPMLFYVLDNLQLTSEDTVFIIYYNVEKELFETTIHNKYPNVHLIELKEQTKGAAETIYKGLQYIKTVSRLKKCVLLDCDTFYTEDILTMYRSIDSNAVFYTNNTEPNPIFSYIKLNTDGKIIEITEKKKISDNANTGIYCFNDIDLLFEYSKKVVSENITFKNECYTSCIIDQMIKKDIGFIGVKLQSQYVFNLGTPTQVQDYVNKTFSFLFDLDGTIIFSETIYYDIWKEILIEYNIELTHDVFDRFISGNSDETVINTLLNNKGATINELSDKKDNLFIKNIDSVRVIDGAYEFIKEIRRNGHKTAIVTNCNRKVTEYILHHFNLFDIIDVIVIGCECANPKPYPDPYKKAIELLNTSNSRSFIFEDSKTGLLSATSVVPRCIIGIETIYSHEELLNYGATITIKNYICLDFNSIIANENFHICLLKDMIHNSLVLFDIKTIEINSNKLKGGFISDVIQVNIVTKDETCMSTVLKMENKNESFLSTMSNNLDLYNREYYFYDVISKYVPIKYPKSYGLIKDRNFDNIGVLLENLNTPDFVLNIDLNKAKINTSLTIIDNLAVLHSSFWNKNIDRHFKELKKNNAGLFDWSAFVNSKWDTFKNKWSSILTSSQLDLAEYIVCNFSNIQEKLSDKNLTFCHGDVKSANIFYKKLGGNSYEPYFIDWQYITLGKGVQDLVFFMIESFDIERMRIYKKIFKDYYYVKLLENGVKYDISEYNADFINASYYFPFFVAIWFGTLSEDELIDKQFPRQFIQKLFSFYELDH
jgi:beta-phosphoglucomutase-like phosphatase (HAD superfamily)/choline kinase/thiamine kinase-like enzyme